MSEIRRFALFLLALFAIEAVVFYSQYAAKIAPFPPGGFDQLSYLILSYDAMNRFLTLGWLGLPHFIIEAKIPTGATWPIQGALMAIIGGANRTAMISLNLVYFIALQAMLFFAIARRGNVPLAITALGLLLCAHTLFLSTGGMFDYRIDFAALCLYGIWVCAILCTDGFLDPSWSVAAGLTGAALIAMRFFTIFYVGPTLLILFIILLILKQRRQALNTFVCGIVTLIGAAPFLYIARTSIYNYYVVGHFIGAEKSIRAAELGIVTTQDHLLFYIKSILSSHLGNTFILVAVVLLALGIQGWRCKLFSSKNSIEFIFLGSAILVPFIILTMDESKSPVVGGVLTVPILMMVVAAINPMRVAPIAATLAIIIGCGSFLANANTTAATITREQAAEINRLNADAAKYLVQSKLVNPRIAVDVMNEYMNVQSIALAAIEQMDLRQSMNFNVLQSFDGLQAISRDDAFKAVDTSDLVVLTSQNEGRSAPYPFNAKMKAIWPELEDHVSKTMRVIASGTIAGLPCRIFARPSDPPSSNGSSRF